MKTCLSCGGSMVKSQRRTYHYTACGLDNVYLDNVDIYVCHDCKERCVQIPQMDCLHRTLARWVAGLPEELSPAEIRFLRKYLGYSSKDFARTIEATAEEVAAWESKGGMIPEKETKLRLWAATRGPLTAYASNRTTQKKTIHLSRSSDSHDGWKDPMQAALG